MATITQAIKILSKYNKLEMENIRNDSNEPTYHHVKHKYRDTIIVPLIAIEKNITFILSKGEKYLIFADSIKAKVVGFEEKDICSLEKDIQDIYQIDAWKFLKKWKNVYPNISSIDFFIIKCKKE